MHVCLTDIPVGSWVTCWMLNETLTGKVLKNYGASLILQCGDERCICISNEQMLRWETSSIPLMEKLKEPTP